MVPLFAVTRRLEFVSWSGRQSSQSPALVGCYFGSSGGGVGSEIDGDANVGAHGRINALSFGDVAFRTLAPHYRVGRNITVTFVVSFSADLDENPVIAIGRTFMGLWDQVPANPNLPMTGIVTDDPIGNLAMVRFSPGTDTTFKFITKDGVMLNVVDTGIVPDRTTEYFFTLQENLVAHTWQLLLGQTLVATSSLHLPSGALGFIWNVQNVTPPLGSSFGAKINTHQIYIELDK